MNRPPAPTTPGSTPPSVPSSAPGSGSPPGAGGRSAAAGTPPSRPGRRRRLLRGLGLGAAAAVVAVLAFSLAARAYARQHWNEARSTAEAALGPLDPGAYLRPAVPDRDNAALAFERVARALDPDDMATVRALQALAYEPRSAWPPAAEAEAVLETYATTIGELHAAGRARGFGLGLDYRLGWQTPRPHLFVYSQAGRLLLAHGRWSLARGDEAAALASARALAAAARGLESEPPLVVKFFGHHAERQLHGLVATALDEGAGAGTLAELRALLRGLPRPIDLRQALGYDAAAMALWIETRIPAGPRRARAELCAGETTARYAELDRLSGRELVAAMRRAEAIAAGQAESGPTETGPVRRLRRHSDRASWWAVLCAGMDGTVGVTQDAGVEGSSFALPYLGMEYEAFEMRVTESARQLAESALALGLHARATGGYPPALDAVPGAGVPAPLTGEAPRYRLLPGGGAALGYPEAETAVAELSGLHPRSQPRLAWELPPAR